MTLTIGLVALISLMEVLASQFQQGALTALVALLPFHTVSMGWLVPGLVGLLVALLLPDKQKGQAFDLEAFNHQD